MLLSIGGFVLVVVGAGGSDACSHEIDDDIRDPAAEDEPFEPPLVIPPPNI